MSTKSKYTLKAEKFNRDKHNWKTIAAQERFYRKPYGAVGEEFERKRDYWSIYAPEEKQ